MIRCVFMCCCTDWQTPAFAAKAASTVAIAIMVAIELVPYSKLLSPELIS